MTGREVGLVGRAQPDVDDVGAARLRPARERRGELRRRVAHVVPDDDGRSRRADLVDETGGERLHDLRGELGADEAPHVISLDDLREVGGGTHAYEPSSPITTCRMTCQPCGAESRSACRAHRS